MHALSKLVQRKSVQRKSALQSPLNRSTVWFKIIWLGTIWPVTNSKIFTRNKLLGGCALLAALMSLSAPAAAQDLFEPGSSLAEAFFSTRDITDAVNQSLRSSETTFFEEGAHQFEQTIQDLQNEPSPSPSLTRDPIPDSWQQPATGFERIEPGKNSILF